MGLWVFLLLYSSTILASKLGDLRTIQTIESGFTKLRLRQFAYFSPNSDVYLYREHELTFAATSQFEISINIPLLDYISSQKQHSTSLGDIILDLNIHLNPKNNKLKFGLWNLLVQFNFGTGPKYTSSTSHPITSYGYQELSFGVIYLKKFRYVSIHANLIYTFRYGNFISHEGTVFQEKTIFAHITEGDFLNAFSASGWIKGLGFNVVHPEAIFFWKNLRNDLLKYYIAVNTQAFYPWIPFIELSFTHDFWFVGTPTDYPRPALNAGIYDTKIIFGNKVLLVDNKVQLFLNIHVPFWRLRELYTWGLSFGFSGIF